MSELVTPSGTVHWIGTGLSTGSGLAVVADRVQRVVLLGAHGAKAEACLDRLGLTGRAATGAYDLPALADQLAAGDVVVSMLPGDRARRAAEPVHRAGRAFRLLQLHLGRDRRPGTGGRGGRHRRAHRVRAGPGHRPPARAQARRAGPGGDRRRRGDGGVHFLLRRRPGGGERFPVPVQLGAARRPHGAVLAGALHRGRGGARGRAAVGGHRASYWTASRSRSTRTATACRSSTSTRSRTLAAGHLRPGHAPPGRMARRLADVFAELREGDAARITALADDLAAPYPTTDADRDRVVLAVALRVRAAVAPPGRASTCSTRSATRTTAPWPGACRCRSLSASASWSTAR